MRVTFGLLRVTQHGTLPATICLLQCHPPLLLPSASLRLTAAPHRTPSLLLSPTPPGTETQPGVIPLTVHDIFQLVADTPQREFLLRVSYMEIYNESVNDLLRPGNTNLKVKKRGARRGRVGQYTCEWAYE